MPTSELISGKPVCEGLEKVEELPELLMAWMEYPSDPIKDKLNELIRVVNTLVELKNGEAK